MISASVKSGVKVSITLFLVGIIVLGCRTRLARLTAP